MEELSSRWENKSTESLISTQPSPLVIPSLPLAEWMPGSSRLTLNGNVHFAQDHHLPQVRSVSSTSELSTFGSSACQYPVIDSSQLGQGLPTFPDPHNTSICGVVPEFEAGSTYEIIPDVPLLAAAELPENYMTWAQPQPDPSSLLMENHNRYAAGRQYANSRQDRLSQAAISSQQFSYDAEALYCV
ncbi:hypothetical protein NW762_008879 [Fusarium torreyae]|uniref:Uncharacterized protein n=1 Tax=Fusarium torreyae TaxID=1237075 RepID=A0A9W8RYA2_9HYPO|nr:hypothetical protein NW762_008879 [Fusarium torreyae]